MKTKLISTRDYLLLIDEEAEIKENDTVLSCIGNEIIKSFPNIGLNKAKEDNNNKIIAYRPLTKEAKELDLPLLPNPFNDKAYWIATVIFKDGTKLKSEKFYKYDSGIKSWSSNFSYLMEDKIESISYDKYTENQPEQFSLEDMKKAFEYYAFASVSNQPYNDSELEEQFEKFIQSLSTQQLPKEFIMVKVDTNAPVQQYKSIMKSGGKHELVGTYKY